MSKSAHLIFTFFIFLFIPLLFIQPQKIHAAGKGMYIGDFDTQKGNQERRTAIDAVEDGKTPIFGQNTQEYMLGSLVYNATNMVVCTDPDTKYCNPQKTAMGNITLAMQEIYANPPASLAWYTRDLAVNMGLIKPSYAQGIGFAGLSPLLGIWKATRNMAYAVLVIVMVAIGFMIIFRTKIDPKTVISVQAALPKIVVTLILITFSYPIVGFLIDIMYLSMAVVIGLIADGFGTTLIPNKAALQTDFMGGWIGTLFFMVFNGGLAGDKIGALIGSFGGISAIGGGVGAVAATGWGQILTIFGATGFLNVFLGGLLGTAVVAGIILAIIALGLLFTFIRLLMLLFNSYIQVLLSLLLAPILLLREAIPGQSAFGEWILTVMANLVVFPATAAILIFAMTITKLFASTPNIWSPPLAAMPNGMFGYFVGLSIIFTSPNMVISIKKLFNPKPATPISAGSPLTPVTGAVGTGMGAASQFYYMKGLIDMITKKPGTTDHRA